MTAVKLQAARKSTAVFQDLAGNPLSLKGIDKHYRDTLAFLHGVNTNGKVLVAFDPDNPLGDKTLTPGPDNPLCKKCGLYELGAASPFINFHGADDPLVTVVTDGVTPKEDQFNELAAGGTSAFLKKLFSELGFDITRVRWAPITRCCARKTQPNLATKGRWCRHFLVQDLLRHPPKVLMPVGSVALGLLSHKSNAQDWSGYELTYRGWPDDWLTTEDFARPRPHPADATVLTVGHPLFGKLPALRILMVPIQAPRLVYASQNQKVIKRWHAQVKHALDCAVRDAAPKAYDKPWWKLSTDPLEITRELSELIDHPGTLVAYDTETNGLKPWGETASIVFLMFRWLSPVTGKPKALGFPWNYPESPLYPHLDTLTPVVLNALYSSKVVGHNLTFDMLFTAANLKGADLNRLADSAAYDTWHMAYILKQATGTLGLEMIAYQWVPDLAGYEEDMSLLIELHRDTLHPDEGGHYANCPRDKWETHLKPYVMGDVEVAYQARQKLDDKLKQAASYKIPLAHPEHRGRFRWFEPPQRHWVYHHIVSPAARLLIKMMGRGMYVDTAELAKLEDLFPKKIQEVRDELRQVDPRIIAWCEQNEATKPGWELDLENKTQLKECLFHVLQLPVKRLTEVGQRLFGEKTDPSSIPREDAIKYAALDKYTLNVMSVDYPQVRPLQTYRKIFKEYSSYIRPMRNVFTLGLDKTERKASQHLARDGCVHASFLLTGTRGGRLSCKEPNLQQLPREGLIKRVYASRFKDRGCVYQGDLSQIELRVMAAACGDAAMVGAYHQGIDLHALTHSKIFRKPYEECVSEYVEWLQSKDKLSEAKKLKEERKVAKCTNFLTGYGGGAFGLQNSLAAQGIYLSLEECENILESFFDAYPALRRYLSYYKSFILKHGCAVSIFGRVRIFEEVFSDNEKLKAKALRAGCNHLIQSTASDMMLICLGAIEACMRHENLESILVSTVHDSLVIDALKSELPVVHEIVTGVLNNIPEVLKATFGDDYDTSWCLVPFSGDAEVGPNMLDTRKVGANPDWDELLSR